MTLLHSTILGVLPRFKSITRIRRIDEAKAAVYVLEIIDGDALENLIKEAVHKIEGVETYENNPAYRRMCDETGLSKSDLFIPRMLGNQDAVKSAEDQLHNVQMGDMGELLGYLVLAAHFDVPLDRMFPRNLAKPSVRRSESGFDIAIIALDLDSDATDVLGDSEQFTAVESKASREDSPTSLSYKARRSFEQDVQGMQKLLQMYFHFAEERFKDKKAVARIPFFLFEFHMKTSKFRYASMATTPSVLEPDHIATIDGHLAELKHGFCVVCTVKAEKLVKMVYEFRSEAS